MASGVKALSSVMQLSTFTRITSIPRKETYNDFPVAVRLKAQDITAPLCPPVDIIAVMDISGSMGDVQEEEKSGSTGAIHVSGQKATKLEHEKKAMLGVINRFAGDQNRLAFVPFDDLVHCTPLKNLNEEWRKELAEKVNNQKFIGGTNIAAALAYAGQVLAGRSDEEKGPGRSAFIILFSDGSDPNFKEDIQKTKISYPIHAFGFWANPKDSPLKMIPDLKLGTYTYVNHVDKVTEKLNQLYDGLISRLAVDTRINLKTMHPGVTLSKIEPSAGVDDVRDSYSSQISQDKESGQIFLGVVTSGKERDFTVYLNVPKAQGNAMELLMVGGMYKQSWDLQQVPLDDSVVTVARPDPCTCKELDRIKDRLEYWCKVKQDLSSGIDDGNCQCLVSEVLREASLEAIDSAMHQDIYTAVQHALNLRLCGDGGVTEVAMENVTSPTA